MKTGEKIIFELSKPGCRAVDLPACDVPTQSIDTLLPEKFIRRRPAALPEVSQPDLVRHYTALANRNFGVDNGFYPLGSCTMKYNPKVNEDIANYPGFAALHPLQPEETVQGALQLMYELGECLTEIAGMDAVTLQPAAGAHGELTGLKLIRAFHRHNGQDRTEVIVPDSAHGTNPASSAVCGLKIVEVKSDEQGLVDTAALRQAVGPNTAALMLTNPNTLGLFEKNIQEITQIVHEAGGLVYYDGANANAIMGIVRPGDMGFDVVHVNLHKTFSTPHGGGGPGSGPVAVKKELAPFLPVPVITFDGEKYHQDFARPLTIGKVQSFSGNFGIMVRAYAYIKIMGAAGLLQASRDAVLNANYCLAKLKNLFTVPFAGPCMHECVLSAANLKPQGIRALDIAKRLLDYGYHPPTIYFPLIVEEALMIEPTETENKATLDRFIAAMEQIIREAETDADLVKSAPHTTVVGRLDETAAARKPVVRWQPPAE